MQLETPLETVETAAALAAKAGVPVILIQPQPVICLPGCLTGLNLTPNETEAKYIDGRYGQR